MLSFICDQTYSKLIKLMEQENLKSNLEKSLREAEQLETGRSKEYSVGISQLSAFFKSIQENQEFTDEGKDLLSFRVDLTIADRTLDSFEKMKTKEIQETEETIQELISYRKASTHHENKLNENISNEWKRIMNKSAAILQNMIDDTPQPAQSYEAQTSSPVSQKSKDVSFCQTHSKRATDFAKVLYEKIKSKSTIGKLLPFICDICREVIEPNNPHMHHQTEYDGISRQYFRALKTLLNGKTVFTYTPKKALVFLMQQYREVNGYTSSAVIYNEFVHKIGGGMESDMIHDDDSMSQLSRSTSFALPMSIDDQCRFIWKLFRAGYFTDELPSRTIFEDLVQTYGIAPILNQTIAKVFQKWTNKENIDDDDQIDDEDDESIITEIQNHVVTQIFDDMLKNTEISEYDQEIVQTAEDYLFILLLPLFNMDTSKTTNTSAMKAALEGIKAIVREECSQIVKKNEQFKFISPLFSILTGQFNLAIEQLLEIPQIYVEACHVAFALYQLPMITPETRFKIDELVNEYTELLLPNHFSEAVCYQFLIVDDRNSSNPSYDRICHFLIKYPFELSERGVNSAIAFDSDLLRMEFIKRTLSVIRKNPILPIDTQVQIDLLTSPNENKTRTNTTVSQDIESVIKHPSAFTLQQLLEIAVRAARPHVLEIYAAQKSEGQFKVRRYDPFEKRFYKSSNSFIPTENIEDFRPKSSLIYLSLHIIQLIRMVLFRSDELSLTDRVRLSEAAHYIESQIPEDKSVFSTREDRTTYKLINLLDLLISYDQNNTENIEELLFKLNALPKHPDDVSNYYTDLFKKPKHDYFIDNKGTFVPTVIYYTIVYLYDKKRKSEDDINMMCALFKLSKLIKMPLDTTASFESLYKKCKPFLQNID